MSHMNIKALLDRWTNDPEFRKAMRQNAEATLQKEMIVLSPEERRALQHINWKLSDAELKTQISKAA